MNTKVFNTFAGGIKFCLNVLDEVGSQDASKENNKLGFVCI